LAEFPNVLIHTSGEDVGLPDDTMGNSEVGHQNLGAGRIVYQESVRITKAVREETFFANEQLLAAVRHARVNGAKLHLFGIASDVGVHGLMTHCYACVELAAREGLKDVYVHAFTDGRDSPPTAGEGYLTEIEAKLAEIGVGRLATVCGRYFAMDRDNRWDRVEKAYRLLTRGEGAAAPSGPAACKRYYANPTDGSHTGDEFILPTVVTDDGQPRGRVESGDAVVFYNYRGDRPRELIKAFQLDDFDGFDRGDKLDLYFVTMTEYQKGLPVRVAFPKPPKMANITGEYLAAKGLKQFRCAETEKYPHVTFFFNDYREEPFDGEDRQIIPSPKVATYDVQPEMSAYEVTEEMERRIASEQYDVVVLNYANGDMVGHTGKLDAAIKACAVVDEGVGRVLDAVQKRGGTAIVTADHGNAEQMIHPESGGPHTAHTTYDVDLIVVDDRLKGKSLRPGGRLADVMPTGLEMIGLDPPAEMEGRSLLHL
jgi:2,3-bisphosphoglycerate-independent phosphoglycerate mutase